MLQGCRDFLELTLTHPIELDPVAPFELGGHTRVSLWDTGVLVFEPLSGSSKDIVISSGVHGNETAPIEMCNSLIQDLLGGALCAGERVLFLIGNPPAINNGTRIVDENMNRLFSGEHSRGPGLCHPERVRAKKLEAYVTRFFNEGGEGGDKSDGRHRIHYDLHTAIRGSKHEKFAIYPYRAGRAFSGEQIMFLAAAGVDTVLFHHEPTTTFSYFSSEHFRADAFTIELGKVFPMGQNDMSKFADTREMLKRLICAEPLGLAPFDETKVNLYQVRRVINKQADDFEFTFSSDVPNFTAFEKGHVIAREAGRDILIEADSEAVVFPNAKVPIGQRTVIMLVPARDPDVR
ncbi:succinylglutamate desuccinylase [Shewanella sp. JM162201]|uniref:Succinylglutamate desuccinylase n=1 Tax=Shewanella jiangmenensis TaxID=2837387 RepID=A0ABS5V4Y2_9GAMM|nr:succinylglutamate desuccinylase [Shewanella jiangmenensis]MBT1445518.1 succinylglutamate desuccinylase [Shewanella jiangmenensis]